MKKKKVLFIASLPSKKQHLDGERNKSGVIFECLKKMGFKITVVDYTKNKYIQSIKLLTLIMTKKYDLIFISKCAVGGSFALHLVLRFGKKINKDNIYFYIIGNGFKGFDISHIYKDDFQKCRKVIVESPFVVKEMSEYNINNCYVFPCVKRIPSLNPTTKEYNTDSPLRLIYFSRITEEKGLTDLIQTVKLLNNKKVMFFLDIAGGVSKEEIDYEKKVIKMCDNDENMNYLGESFSIIDDNSYKQLQRYDLHVFPSHFFQECAPGSIIDMFIAGVPTLSSEFENAKNILNEDNSFFFKFMDTKDLASKLLYVYSNKETLNNKRLLSSNEAKKYSVDSFIAFLREIFEFKDCPEADTECMTKARKK